MPQPSQAAAAEAVRRRHLCDIDDFDLPRPAGNRGTWIQECNDTKGDENGDGRDLADGELLVGDVESIKQAWPINKSRRNRAE